MSYLFATLAAFILGVTITVIVSRALRQNNEVQFVPQAPPETLNNAIAMANKFRCDYLVVFEGPAFRIVKSSYQHSVNGFVVYVAHPEAI